MIKNIKIYHEILKIMVASADMKVENNDPIKFERGIKIKLTLSLLSFKFMC